MIRFYIYAIVFNLGILIFVHELGHFLAARASGVTVERFSMGFGPRIIKFTRGATEYALSLIPFGGYVKMSGAEQPAEGQEAELGPGTFLGKRLGVRAVIVAAGPTTNLVWAVIVIIGVLMFFGLPTLGEPVLGEVDPSTAAGEAGLRLGDRIVSVEGTDVESWDDVLTLIDEDRTGAVDLTIVRGKDPGVTIDVSLPYEPGEGAGGANLGLTAFAPPVVGGTMTGGLADKAGLRAGDRIVSVDGKDIRTWGQLSDVIHDSAGVELNIVWERNGETMSAAVVPEAEEEAVSNTEVRTVGMIGIMPSWQNKRLGFGEAVGTGLQLTWVNLRAIADFFVALVTHKVSGSMVGGPIRVVQMASESARWGASYFFGFMAFMSINLFLINMLPLPILDGGHLLLMALEKVRGRGLTERQLLVWQQVGLVFFAGLMAFLLVRDAVGLG